jgi:D-alanine-D-alanine ligase
MRAKIALIHDAHAAEGRIDSSDTLLEAQSIAEALGELGYGTTTVPVGLDLAAVERAMLDAKPHAVVNLVESLAGRGQLLAAVPALLESMHVPFTGCSANALGVTTDKRLAKGLLRRAGLPAPELFDTAAGDDVAWIVKAVHEHASLGLDDQSVVRGAKAVASLLEARSSEFGGRWFAERFVPGRELNVAMIAAPDGPRALPVAEIRFDGFPPDKPAIVGYAAKWHVDSFEYLHTVRSFAVERPLATHVTELARACWDLFALDGYARVDFRVDAVGRPWVLEVNANPCLSPDAGFAAALAEAQIPYVDAIAWLIADARRRA